MEIASLIIIIVSLILLIGIIFLLFQVWLTLKEIKIIVPKFFDELKSHNQQINESILNLKSTFNEISSKSMDNTKTEINKNFENLKKIIEFVGNNFTNQQLDLKEEFKDAVKKIQENFLMFEKNISQKLSDDSLETKNAIKKLQQTIIEPLDL